MYPDHSAYRAAWSKAFTDDPPVPLNVDVELASLCNLSCPFCAWGDHEDFVPLMRGNDFDGKPKRRFMDELNARRLIDECARIGVPALKFNFRGEATLHPQFSEIISYAAEKNTFHDLLLNTNGNGPAAALPGLLKLTKVMFSLDSMVEETYRQMRVGGDYGRALFMIEELLNLGHTNVWAHRVITKLNEKEAFADSVHRMFGRRVHVSEHYAFDRSGNQLMLEEPDGGWGRQYCGYPSQRLVVTASGKVLPCCVSWRDEILVGVWPEQSLIDIWRGTRLADLRKTLRENAYSKAPALCKNCTSYMSYQRKEREHVQNKETM